MSEANPAGGSARRLDTIDHSLNRSAGIVLIAVSLIGPVAALFWGKGGGITDILRQGYFSLPLAVFGIVALTISIRNPKDYYGGLMLIALGLFALWASGDLPGMRGFAFGPGTAPRLFAYLLLACGLGVVLVGLLSDGPPLEPFSFSGPLGGAVLLLALIPVTFYSGRIGHLLPGIAPDVVVAAVGAIVVLALAFFLVSVAPRGPVFITAATLIFAITVRPLGLVVASFVSLVVSAYATEEIRWIETLIWAAILTLFCALLFPWGLNLPLPLWPRF